MNNMNVVNNMNSKSFEIIKSNVEYELLPYQFVLITFWGIWCPRNWSLRRYKIHKIYFMTISTLNVIICIEMFIDFICSISTKQFKLTNLFVVSANMAGVYKAIKLMQGREALRCLIETYFDHSWMNPQDLIEDEFHRKINFRIRNILIVYSASMLGIVFLKASSPLIETGATIALPVDAYYPYSIESTFWLWVTYFQQVILGSSSVCAHIGIDTLFVGLLLKISLQIDVLKYRLRNMEKYCTENLGKFKCIKDMQRNIILQCIHHHERIYRFGEDLNNHFQDVLIILVICSIPNICINVYALSAYKNEINLEYITTLFSTTSAFLQFYIVCWFGNEVFLNSIQIKSAVYEMDWLNFDVSIQKLLIIIMARSAKPIQFSVGHIIPMNLDSFLKIVKMSYAVVNVLQQTSG